MQFSNDYKYFFGIRITEEDAVVEPSSTKSKRVMILRIFILNLNFEEKPEGCSSFFFVVIVILFYSFLFVCPWLGLSPFGLSIAKFARFFFSNSVGIYAITIVWCFNFLIWMVQYGLMDRSYRFLRIHLFFCFIKDDL